MYVRLYSKTIRGIIPKSAYPQSYIQFIYIYVYTVIQTVQRTRHTHTHTTQTYQQNFHLVDFNLVIFTIVILSRRLAWCTLQELQAHWNPKSAHGSLNFKRWMVVACTLLVIAWSVVRLVQQTSLFNLLFLFYP